MSSLKSSELQVVQLMTRSDEHARHGFVLLANRPDAPRFFDDLESSGLFHADRNPAPVQDTSGRGMSIPYWGALDYLVACAKLADKNNDLTLAARVTRVIREVSGFREDDGSIRDNYHTFRVFAEILGTLPLAALTEAEIALVETWLQSRFDRNGVANALNEGVIARLLQSDQKAHWELALDTLAQCLTVHWIAPKPGEPDLDQPTTQIDPYWLSRLLSNHSAELGRKMGLAAIKVLATPVRIVFGTGSRSKWSWVFRPAVEDHSQNHDWRSVDNCFVEGMRDALLAWCTVDPQAATPYLTASLADEGQMLRRVSIYAIAERFDLLSSAYSSSLRPELFDSDNIHELYGLLRKNFQSFSEDLKNATIAALRERPQRDDEDGFAIRQHEQARWLGAIAGFGYEPVNSWLRELLAAGVEVTAEHPDFNSYVESGWRGPGASPYPAEQLVAFIEDGILATRLSEFVPDEWRGPSVDGLSEALQQAVVAAPDSFAKGLSDLLEMIPVYQNAILAGFKRSWDSSKGESHSGNWPTTWTRLIEMFEALLAKTRIGSPDEVAEGLRWQASLIADLLRAGTADDSHAYPAILLPRGWTLVRILLARHSGAAEPSADAMTQAMNTPKGHAIEAMWSHVLRECRIADAHHGSHQSEWTRFQDDIERELDLCADANFEYSTLAAAYLANIAYLAPEWLQANCKRIFPAEWPRNFICAVDGLAYAGTSRRIYEMLRDAGILDAALRLKLEGREARKQLVERVTLGYVWGIDDLAGPRMQQLFRTTAVDDLSTAIWTLGRAKGEVLEAVQRDRIVALVYAVVDWANENPDVSSNVLSHLGNLVWALDNAEGQNKDALLAIARNVGQHHGMFEFVPELDRFAKDSPSAVADLLDAMIASSEVMYDYEDRIKLLIEMIAENGQRKRAVDLANKLRYLPGMRQVFSTLT